MKTTACLLTLFANTQHTRVTEAHVVYLRLVQLRARWHTQRPSVPARLATAEQPSVMGFSRWASERSAFVGLSFRASQHLNTFNSLVTSPRLRPAP
jgi:hypothetical protein